MNKKIVFFDMGNTLLHFHKGESDDEKDLKGLLLLTDYLKKYNNHIDFNSVKNIFFENWMNGIDDRKISLKEYPIEDFLNDFLKPYKVNLSLNQCIEAINIFYTEYRENVYFESDLSSTLKSIKELGYKIGVISNTCYYDEVMIECFKKAEIFNFIDSFTFSYSLRIGKPSKEIFKAALNKVKISPNNCIMVGDNLNSDIKPALELRMNTIWFNKDNKELSGEIIPNAIISDLSDLIKILK